MSLQDMTAVELASHWRAQAARCREEVDRDRQRILTDNFGIAGSAADSAGRIIRNTVMAEALERCADEILERLK